MCAPWPQGKKLVHLDLKGAPPKIGHLHQLIECFAQLGADGLLVEYEDMFPYEGQLGLLQASAQPVYSRDEVLSIQEVAKSKGMEVIPLVQTFGHMEFVLKHPSLWGLREVPQCVGTLNPHKEEGMLLVMEMVRQVVELHPGLSALHIGADEVYMLGEGEMSKEWLSKPGHTVDQLFLSHVTKVVKGIKEVWPNMSIIMWDDMLRGMSCETLTASSLVSLVQPMLWDYSPHLDVHKTVSLLEMYHNAGMVELWAASSFKGSTSVYTSVPSTQRHVENHLQWLKVAEAVSSRFQLKGIAITGWQRYDHLSVLCELMPVALPSLAACLHTLIHGDLSAEAQSTIAQRLGVSSLEVEAMGSGGDDNLMFPGRKLAEVIVKLNSLLNSDEFRFFEKNRFLQLDIVSDLDRADGSFVRGWFSLHQRQTKMVSPVIVLQIHSQASIYLAQLRLYVEALREEMVRLYPDSTAREWIEEHVSPVMGPLQRIVEEIPACLKEIMP